MPKLTRRDPVEDFIAKALEHTQIRYIQPDHTWPCLDFYLVDLKVYIEVKRFSSDTNRASEQLSRAPNVILIQGFKAAKAFAQMIGVPLEIINQYPDA